MAARGGWHHASIEQKLHKELRARLRSDEGAPEPPPKPRQPRPSSSDDVASLLQRLKQTERLLKKSEKTITQQLRQIQKLEERSQSMMRLQQLIAERQLNEVGCHVSTNTNTEHSHSKRLRSVRTQLSQRFDAQSTAATMYERCAITLRELQDIQTYDKQPIKAAEKLIDIVIGQPNEVYEKFMEAVKENNGHEILDMIVNSTFPDHMSMTGHALQLRQHYVQLLDILDTKYSGLLDELFSVKVLNGREKSTISQETSSYRQNELLLSYLCYKTESDYDRFLAALDKTDQGHVRNAITGRTEQEQEQEARAYDDTDSTSKVTDSAEVVQLRHELQKLAFELTELRSSKSNLEQKIKKMTHPYQNLDTASTPAAAAAAADRRINPTLLTTLKIGDKVNGVAELDGNIYTVCQGSEAIRSYRYDCEDSVIKLKDIVVRGMKDACDLVACLKTKRLYVADQHVIWVVTLTSHTMRINTSPVRPHALSVRDGHVLVTSQHSKQLVQYCDKGQELLRVSLPGNMTSHHAAMTSRGTFLVCCNTTSRASGDQHQVAEVNRSGRVLQSFDSDLKYPWYIVIIEDTDQCLVADRNNFRVLHLGSDLLPTGVVIDSPQGPSRLCLTGSRLLVAHSTAVDIFTLR